MRGFSLWQLSASAIAHGAKTIETRRQPAPASVVGTRVAIASSKALGPGGLIGLEMWMLEEHNRQWLYEAGYLELDATHVDGFRAHPESMPRGTVVCTAVLDRVEPTEDLVAAGLVSDLEWLHGDYSPGRFGWVLNEVRRLKRPVPVAGALGFYRIDPEVATQVRRQEIKEPVVPALWTPDTPVDRSQPPRRFNR